jgi:DNA repair exonuclease SbcCD nuclease subunit
MPDLVLAHASDVHVDNGYTARLFGGDGTGGLKAVVCAARKSQADVLVLAGDTFDRHGLPDALIAEAGRVLSSFRRPVVVLPGNHDPAVEDAIFHHGAFRAIDNVHVIGVTHPEAVALPGLELEVWGLAHRDYFDMSPLARVRERTTRWLVAVAHGHYMAAPDRSNPARPSWIIDDEDIAATKADYVALGHWNRRVSVGNGSVHAWYSGSPDFARSINVVRFSDGGSVEVGLELLDLPVDFGCDVFTGVDAPD